MSEVIHGLPFEEYLEIDAISAHGLMLISRSPAHFRQAAEDSKKATSNAKRRGTLAHELILTPEQQEHILVPGSASPTRNDDKEALCEAIGIAVFNSNSGPRALYRAAAESGSIARASHKARENQSCGASQDD